MRRPNVIMRAVALLKAVAWDGPLDVVCPRTCLLCSAPEVDEIEGLCDTCLRALGQATGRPYCPRCGETAPPYGLRPEGCGNCRGRRLPYDLVIRVGTYRGAWAALLRVFKYHGREELDGFFTRQLARRLAQSSVYEEIDAVVAVPTCWQHRLRRLFHPAGVVGRQVALRCGIPFADVLVRTGGGPHQVGQTRTARVRNVRGKFHLAWGCLVRGAKLCLVDDVMTTGATVAECSRVLKRAGAAAVYVAVLARAGDDPVTLMHV